MEGRSNHSVIETPLFEIPNKNRTGGDAVTVNTRIFLGGDAIQIHFTFCGMSDSYLG